MSNKKLFQPGDDGHGGGRRAGARNKLQTTLLEELATDFERHGAGVIRICRVEKPIEYLKAVISVLPKELIVEQSNLADLTDEQVTAYIGILQTMQMRAVASTAPDLEKDDTRH